MNTVVILAEIDFALVFWMALLAAAVFVAVRYRKEVLGFGGKFKIFLNEVVDELRKSSWPTWIELRDSTIVVVIAVAALAIFVGLADTVFVKVIEMLTSRK